MTIKMAVQNPVIPKYSFFIKSCYSSNTFIEILIDSGAIEVLTTGYSQYLTY